MLLGEILKDMQTIFFLYEKSNRRSQRNLPVNFTYILAFKFSIYFLYVYCFALVIQFIIYKTSVVKISQVMSLKCIFSLMLRNLLFTSCKLLFRTATINNLAKAGAALGCQRFPAVLHISISRLRHSNADRERAVQSCIRMAHTAVPSCSNSHVVRRLIEL